MEGGGDLTGGVAEGDSSFSHPFSHVPLLLYHTRNLDRLGGNLLPGPGESGDGPMSADLEGVRKPGPAGFPQEGVPGSEVELRQHIDYLAGTIAHYRNWMDQLLARYQLVNPDAARPAKRIYIGNLPATTHEAELRHFINNLISQVKGCAGPGYPIISCKLFPMHPGASEGGLTGLHMAQNNADRTYAFLELRSIEEASNLMALDGVIFHANPLKIRRPNNYDPGLAIMLGPVDPNPCMDLPRMGIIRTMVQDTPNKIFIGGLPCEWFEEQVQELLLPFGRLLAFNLVKDRATGNSKGYAFCEFVDTSVTDVVIQALNGRAVGTKFLTVKRALSPGSV
ncbi:hypothetical protein ACKKBF_B16105 [Auxenochlorella protothecoides x Auxenochlorella symbiontica]|uniref:RRM domain-containing protein n=2 Tax=Auxenochlorella protothecoides TaxID=3075 RepID=A0A1D1ZZJ0_AUXPR|nr:hypothetical protein APUTEX25_000596 [Auxenochlorella protothecoides]|eukprot:RMZ54245.1 hypothetical protein APUTEX25_000596 [Auxenochlorella protothecoides]